MAAVEEGKVGLAPEAQSPKCIFGSISEVGSNIGKSVTSLAAGANPLCPNCSPKQTKVYLDGKRYLQDNSEVQRYLCCKCGLRFSEKPIQKNSKQRLNTSTALLSSRQICALGAKNLTATELKTVAGDLEKLPQARVTLVKDGANLHDPEDVKTKIARHTFKDKTGKIQKWKDSSKNLAAFAYQAFCKMEGIVWERPEYNIEDPIIRTPIEGDIDAIIASTTSRRMAAFLQSIKETYADPGEILAAEWIDLKGNIFTIAHPVKGHDTGEYEISGELFTMLNMLPKTDKRIFPTTYSSIETSFLYIRKRLAAKLGRPQILEINFKSIRHWGGTTIAENTNGNVLIVKQLLRHKCIESSMKYIHAKKFVPKEFEETTATTIEEIRNLGKGGWTKYDELAFNSTQVHFYRRPKRFNGSSNNIYVNSENLKRYSYKLT